MDLIQKAATVALLTLLAYFVLVNIIERNKGKQIHTEGKIKDQVDLKSAQAQFPASASEPISNHLDLDANREVPIEGINTSVGVHTRTTIGGPAPPGGENVTQLAVYNEQAKGVLPVNHDLFEKPADFGSDVTNINQFYRNNPDIFDRCMTSAADVTAWSTQSQDMFNQLANAAPNPQINAWNYET